MRVALSTHTVAVDQWHNKEDELTITKNDFLIGADTMKTQSSPPNCTKTANKWPKSKTSNVY